jgi:hypothetical protein
VKQMLIKEDTHHKLNELKAKYRFKTFSELFEYLLQQEIALKAKEMMEG